MAGARDKGDLDALSVAPLPAQEAILEALGQLGFGFTAADLELGHLHGTGRRLPFHQEIELVAPARYAHAVSEIELTFLAHPAGVEIVLEADKHGGLFSEGRDRVDRFAVGHAAVLRTDWTAEVDSWIQRLVDRHGGPGSPAAYGHDHGHGHHHDDDHHGSGMGVGTAVAAGAAGLAAGAVGGYLVSEAVDEFVDAEDNDADADGNEGYDENDEDDEDDES